MGCERILIGLSLSDSRLEQSSGQNQRRLAAGLLSPSPRVEFSSVDSSLAPDSASRARSVLPLLCRVVSCVRACVSPARVLAFPGGRNLLSVWRSFDRLSARIEISTAIRRVSGGSA